MCGIVGAVSTRNVVPMLLEGLRRLEYRGYDSAGLAVLNGRLHRVRSVGRVAQLAEAANDVAGEIGIAHTRWATHGVPSEANAHPHVSGGVSVVHNGIIENHEEMRALLRGQGYEFSSDTDTEVIAHLVHSELAGGSDLFAAVRRSVARLRGAYAIAVIGESDASHLVLARHGAPLLLGLGSGENFAASDAMALARVAQRVIYLEDGDVAEITRSAVRIGDREGKPVVRPVRVVRHSAEAELGPYRHYMQKEIFEQPMALARTINPLAELGAADPRVFGADAERVFAGVSGVLILACGTSYHAGMAARYWIESLAGLPCTVEIASEYRYRDSVANPDALVVTISQSGETADTLAAFEHARALGQRRGLSICNVAESSLARASDLCFDTRAGPEIGVASTKAFTTQLAALLTLALVLARLRGRLDPQRESEMLHALYGLPSVVSDVLEAVEPQMRAWARKFAGRRSALFLGRGIHYPIAMEGALKLKEISYIHAEAYAAGELKHGPLALVDREMPVVAIAPNDALFEKLKSNLQEVRARGGELYVLACSGVKLANGPGIDVVYLPEAGPGLSPIIHTIPLQLLAYHSALERGNDVDKPRNLAKSVTVE